MSSTRASNGSNARSGNPAKAAAARDRADQRELDKQLKAASRPTGGPSLLQRVVIAALLITMLVSSGIAFFAQSGVAATPASAAGAGSTFDPTLAALRTWAAPDLELAQPATPREALAEVEAIFGQTLNQTLSANQQPGTSDFERGRDATMALRDLAVAYPDLSLADQRTADAYFDRPGLPVAARPAARPTLQRTVCKAVCVHFATTGPDAVAKSDKNRNRVPDYVDEVLKVVAGVRADYIKAGYRAPLPDGKYGGNSKTDIYLGEISSAGLYGFCTTDSAPREPVAPAYCVLDNDYRNYPAHSPAENLRVTAAHEFFHAVQFGYNYYADRWFMEASATWVEDELFDTVDDNRQYLANSQLANPLRPMDQFDDDGWHYGQWIFLRFLSEQMGQTRGKLPVLLNDLWFYLDSQGEASPLDALEALSQVVATGKVTDKTWTADFPRDGSTTSFTDWFTAYSAANRDPASTYSEGAANRYPVAAPGLEVEIGPSNPYDGGTGPLDHLSSVTVAATASDPGVSGTLTAIFDMPSVSDQGAYLIVRDGTGRVTDRLRVDLDPQGDAQVDIAVPGQDWTVEATLVNAGIKYDCDRGTGYTCEGVSRDDNRSVSIAFAWND